MNRRDALGRVALLMGGAVIGAEFFISGCKRAPTNVDDLFEEDYTTFLNEVADTILPTTPKSPGAKAAKVGQFMAVMVRDCYTPADQTTFVDGVTKLDDAGKKHFDKGFLDLSPQKRTELLILLDKEQKAYTANQYKQGEAEQLKLKNDPKYKIKEIPNHYFRMMKELTLLGYFTSEVGATKALRYIETPGHYDGDVSYKKGDKAWALDD